MVVPRGPPANLLRIPGPQRGTEIRVYSMAGGSGAPMKIATWIVALLPVLIASGCRERSIAAAGKSVVVLGIDGMDPNFLERHWDALPNLDRLRKEGEFKRLETSMPPQSPVAWSTFITGRDPGGHGLFDFVHRDPQTMMPVSAMSMATQGSRTISLGSYELPISA